MDCKGAKESLQWFFELLATSIHSCFGEQLNRSSDIIDAKGLNAPANDNAKYCRQFS